MVTKQKSEGCKSASRAGRPEALARRLITAAGHLSKCPGTEGTWRAGAAPDPLQNSRNKSREREPVGAAGLIKE
ncbi:MAG: hypothetical protein R6V86_04375 [Spirochaetia bacterium]